MQQKGCIIQPIAQNAVLDCLAQTICIFAKIFNTTYVGRKKRRNPLLEQVEILDIGAEGKAIAKVNEKVVFVPKVVPGDILDVQVTKTRKKYMEGMPVRFHKYSEMREEPFCAHFAVCGGCKWQNLPYEHQLTYKQKQVYDALERLGKIFPKERLPIKASEKTRFYRNKLEFTFSNKRWLTKEEIESGKDFENHNALGFHVPKVWDKVIDIEKCHLQPDPSNAIRNSIKNYANSNGLSYFDIREQEGFLRNLIIRTASTGELMVIVVFYHEDAQKRDGLLQYLSEEFPEINSLMYIINEKANDSITDQDVLLFSGRDHIWEEMEGLRFKIGPKSFYQTNSEQAYELYKITREFAQLTGDEVVYDLYTGTGTIANFVARQAREVIGIEYVPEAIADAKINAQENKLENTHFYAGDMKDILNENFLAENGIPDVIITDPPRAGMHKDVISTILKANPQRIVYVSCNPATQARDLQLLAEAYETIKIQPVDMFPHTHHVENVALLVRK